MAQWCETYSELQNSINTQPITAASIATIVRNASGITKRPQLLNTTKHSHSRETRIWNETTTKTIKKRNNHRRNREKRMWGYEAAATQTNNKNS